MGYDHQRDVSTTEESEEKGMLEPLVGAAPQTARDEGDGNPCPGDDNVHDTREQSHAGEQQHLARDIKTPGSVHATHQIARPFTALHDMRSEVDEGETRENQRGDLDNDYENEFMEVADKAGLYYKVHRENPMQEYQSTLYKMLPRTQIMRNVQEGKKPLTSAEELAEYKFAVQMPFCEKGKRKKVTHERFR